MLSPHLGIHVTTQWFHYFAAHARQQLARLAIDE
jgi:hypothetical protein